MPHRSDLAVWLEKMQSRVRYDGLVSLEKAKRALRLEDHGPSELPRLAPFLSRDVMQQKGVDTQDGGRRKMRTEKRHRGV